MNTLLLQPTDVLFFRDGRPMSGALAGHTASWPLPDVTNHALHAALHRASLEKLYNQPLHHHRRGASGCYAADACRDRKFGSLLTAGPFPVNPAGRWFFPRPKDSLLDGGLSTTLLPSPEGWPAHSSLPKPLSRAVTNTQGPNKEAGGEPWISAAAYHAYLRGQPIPDPAHYLRDDAIADQEANLGIGIDPDTQTTGQGSAEGQIYTAHYLRLRDNFRLGVLAQAHDKEFKDAKLGSDLVRALFNEHPTRIVVGGQQRVCTAHREDLNTLPLPLGLSSGTDFKRLKNGNYAVKWVLLSPAIWPEIPPTKKNGEPQAPHPGGWLPNWVFLTLDPTKGTAAAPPRNGAVLLTSGTGFRKAQRTHAALGGKIHAQLVAAIVPKPLVVTGWALPNATGRPDGGAKSTHLGVAPGAVYYFEAEPDGQGGPGNAVALANALNWHGATPGTDIKNRRSTLAGEKGFGLGVCGTWTEHDNA